MLRKERTNTGTEEVLELTRMTKKGIKDLCKKNKLYQTPELNDVLYLHYQGYRDIECLEEYTGLKCLWLENNAISEISGLTNQKLLRCLFLNNNLITKIENLENCPQLDTVNLANNHISCIENCGVEKLPVLTTLILSHNNLRTAEQLSGVINCKMLSVLDISHNRIEDILVVKIFAQMPELRVLDLDGNSVVSKIPQYRKTLIIECKNLTHLDRRPVFPRDRACAEAWKRGGYEEERKEHMRWNKAERRKIRESVNATLRIRNRGGGDHQVELIGSSSDEDDTERSSAPPKDEKETSPITDTLSIDEHIQYVEYFDPDSLPERRSSREMQKCQVCGRVECNYVHIEERSSIPKVVEAPEEILENSKTFQEENQAKDESNVSDTKHTSNEVNIPNIANKRYEIAEEADTVCELRTLPIEVDDQSSPENYVTDGIAYADNMEEAKVAHAEQSATCTPLLDIPGSSNCFIMDNKPKMEKLAPGLNKLTELTPEICQNVAFVANKEKEDDATPVKFYNSTINNSKNEQSEIWEENKLKECPSAATAHKQAPPQSEKKKQVRIAIEFGVTEKQSKIPTTPVPIRKGRKIHWKRTGEKTKRTKIDRGNTMEDMLDIFADWMHNPLKEEHVLVESRALLRLDNMPVVASEATAFSSTLNESEINMDPPPDGSILSPIFQKQLHTSAVECDEAGKLLSRNSSQEQSNNQREVSDVIKESAEYSQDECDDESVAQKGITHTNPDGSIREFVNSYDAFLNSIEGKLQDISLHCKTSCVLSECLLKKTIDDETTPLSPNTCTEENSAVQDTNLFHDTNQNEVCCNKTEKETFLEEFVSPISDSKNPSVDFMRSTTGQNGSSSTLKEENAGSLIFNDCIGAEREEKASASGNSLFNQKICFTDMAGQICSTDTTLPLYCTEKGCRNSEIIQRLLNSPLTKRLSAPDIVENLHDTTEELLRTEEVITERRIENASETVSTVCSQKEKFEASIEIINNKVIVTPNKKASDGINDNVSSHDKPLEGCCAFPEADNEALFDRQENEKLLHVFTEQPLNSLVNQTFTRNPEEFPDLNSVQLGSADCGQLRENFLPNGRLTQNKSTEIGEKTWDVRKYVADIIIDSINRRLPEHVLNKRFEQSSNNKKESYENVHDDNRLTQAFTEETAAQYAPNECSEGNLNADSCTDNDSRKIFHEAQSSYVISETSNGPEMFEEAREDVTSQDNILDAIAECSIPLFDFSEKSSQNFVSKSTSTLSVLLNITQQATLTTSCWNARNTAKDNSSYNASDHNGSAQLQQKHNFNMETECVSQEHEFRMSLKVDGTENLICSDPPTDPDSEKEDSESHPVNVCFTSEKGRYTI